MSAFLKLPEVCKRTTLSKSTIYDYINKGLFPKQRKIGYNRVGWLEEEVNQWAENRISEVPNHGA